jgi:hypothetical protein
MYGQGAIGYALLPFPTKVNYWCMKVQAFVHFLLWCTVVEGQPPGVA